MNEHINLIKKWIEDPESVSAEELKEAHVATEAAYEAAIAVEAYIAKASNDAADLVYATYATYSAVRIAKRDATKGISKVAIAARWVATYEELNRGN